MTGSGPQTVGLPMYDPVELHAAVDAWLSALARAFRAEGKRMIDRTTQAPGLTLATRIDASPELCRTLGFAKLVNPSSRHPAAYQRFIQ